MCRVFSYLLSVFQWYRRFSRGKYTPVKSWAFIGWRMLTSGGSYYRLDLMVTWLVIYYHFLLMHISVPPVVKIVEVKNKRLNIENYRNYSYYYCDNRWNPEHWLAGGAFDQDILVDRMQSLALSDVIVRWMCAFLQGRHQRVKIGDVLSDRLPVIAGMPQGSYVGPYNSIYNSCCTFVFLLWTIDYRYHLHLYTSLHLWTVLFCIYGLCYYYCCCTVCTALLFSYSDIFIAASVRNKLIRSFIDIHYANQWTWSSWYDPQIHGRYYADRVPQPNQSNQLFL